MWSNANGRQTLMSLCVQRRLLFSNEIELFSHITLLLRRRCGVNCATSCLFEKYINNRQETFFKRFYSTAITTQLPETLACTAPDTCVSGRSVWRNILWEFFCLPKSLRWVPRLQNRQKQSISIKTRAIRLESLLAPTDRPFSFSLSSMYQRESELFVCFSIFRRNYTIVCFWI